MPDVNSPWITEVDPGGCCHDAGFADGFLKGQVDQDAIGSSEPMWRLSRSRRLPVPLGGKDVCLKG
jgi:hypothetical protein